MGVTSASYGIEVLAPPGWRRTPRPLTIAILGWAHLPAREREGSGYNLVAAESASGLAMSGHRVVALRSGIEYSLRPGIRIRKRARWRGIDVYHLSNSPNLAPGLFNFLNPRGDVSRPRQTRLILRWLDSVSADIVHVHALEGYGMDLLKAIRESGRTLVVTPHNYWFVCSQVDLLSRETQICMNYEGGTRCVGCLKPAKPWKARLRRRADQTCLRLLGPHLGTWARRVISEPRRVLGEIFRAPPRAEDDQLDPELARGIDPGSDTPAPGFVASGPALDKRIPIMDMGRSEPDQNDRFLQADHHLTVLNDYGRRRIAGIEALNHAHAVTPPGQFCADLHLRMGVNPERLRVVRLGLPHLDRMYRVAARSAWYDARPWSAESATRPLRFAFFGTVRHNKGIEILVRAVLALPTEVRRRCHFVIRAALGDWLHRRRLAHLPEVSFLGGYDFGQLLTASGEFDVGILPAIWFENSPVVLLEYLSAGKFVLASRLGGTPEWVVEPGSPGARANGGLGNGLMFPGGSWEALAAHIESLVLGRVTIPSAREVHAVSRLRGYPAHVAELDGLYQRLHQPDRVDPPAPSR
ncbi:MAG: glycosyltransferase [Phycisphaerales bacterium]|nr:glycosyltransferase [Phycisphaerales bacterium]